MFAAEQYVAKAEELMQGLQHDLAEQFLLKSLDAHPTHTDSMDLLAELWMDVGRHKDALNLLQKSVQLAPEMGYSKYMYLGQLMDFPDCVLAVRKGIEILAREREALGQVGARVADLAVVQSKIGAAYCSLIETYMTDACYEPDAEERCEEFAQAALREDNGMETNCAVANLRLVQNRKDDARQHLHKAFAFYGGMPAEDLPAYDSRTSFSKMLLETEMVSEAAEVIDGLLQEDDEVSESWFLSGTAHAQLGELKDAKKALDQAIKVAQIEEADPAVVETIQEKIEAVKQALADQA